MLTCRDPKWNYLQQGTRPGASSVTVACTTWPARVKRPCSGLESHRSHIGLLFFPSCISRITKVSPHFFPLGFLGVSLSTLSTTLTYSVVNTYERPYCHKYIYRFATLADDQRERLRLGYLKKTVTCRIPCAGKVTLGKSCTPPNNVLLELGDVRSELGMPDR
jgi:hypothetical protein